MTSLAAVLLWETKVFLSAAQGTKSSLGTKVRDIHVHQTIQMKLILLRVWAERAVLGRAKAALKFKYEI